MRTFCFLILLLIPICASPQDTRTQKTEVEIGTNYSFGAASTGAYNIKYRFAGYFETRFNLKKLPLDVGFRLNLSNFRKQFGGYYEDYDFALFSIMVVVNYSFLRGRRINPYVGFGAGWFSNISLRGCDDCYEVRDHDFNFRHAFAPHIGVKVFDRINLSVSYFFAERFQRHASVRFGYYF